MSIKNYKTMNNSDSTLISKLRLILVEDIKIINDLKSNSKDNSEFNEFLESLIDAKNTIISILNPVDSIKSEIPSPPSNESFLGYNNSNGSSIGLSMLRIINDVENAQMKFVQKNLMTDNIPVEFKNQWSLVLGIYIKITDQIDRSLNTQNVNAISI